VDGPLPTAEQLRKDATRRRRSRESKAWDLTRQDWNQIDRGKYA
jgi:hypothetical protein